MKKKATLHVQHTFLYISLPLSCTTARKLLSYTFYRGNVVLVLVHYFSLPLFFTLHWWPLAFLILSPPLQSSHVVLLAKKLLLCFFISHSTALIPFFSLSFAALPPTVSFSLCFSCSIFQICGHDNYSKLKALSAPSAHPLNPPCFA